MDRLDYRMMSGAANDDFLALYERSVVDVYRYASRLTGGNRADTEELVQATYLAVLQRVGRDEHAELTTGYLVVACRNRFVDDIRSRRRRQGREELAHLTAGASGGAAEPPDPATTAALASLPPDQRAALVLRYVDDLPVADVARLLARSVRATESLLARARTAMRSHLTNGATS